MPNRCCICNHPDREKIELQLVQGVPLRSIGQRFGVSHTSVRRHKIKGHILAPALVRQELKRIESAWNTLREATEIFQKALDLVEEAGRIRDFESATLLLGQCRNCLELIAYIRGEYPYRKDQSNKSI